MLFRSGSATGSHQSFDIPEDDLLGQFLRILIGRFQSDLRRAWQTPTSQQVVREPRDFRSFADFVTAVIEVLTRGVSTITSQAILALMKTSLQWESYPTYALLFMEALQYLEAACYLHRNRHPSSDLSPLHVEFLNIITERLKPSVVRLVEQDLWGITAMDLSPAERAQRAAQEYLPPVTEYPFETEIGRAHV